MMFAKSINPYLGKAPVCLSGIATLIIVACRDFNLINEVWEKTTTVRQIDCHTLSDFSTKIQVG